MIDVTHTALQPGIYDLPHAAYFADPAATPSLSNSIGKVMIDECPLKAWLKHPRLNKDVPAYDSTSKMDFGSVAHELMLGKGAGIEILDFDDFKKDAAKAARDAARERGVIPCLAKNYDRAQKLVIGAIAELKRLNMLEDFAEAKKEVTYIWKVGEIWLRSMIDAVHVDDANGWATIFDLKITERASPDVAERQIGAMNYDLQAHFQRQAVATMHRIHVPRIKHYFLFIEDEFPFLTTPVEMSEAFQECGAHKFSYVTSKWAECMAGNKWPRYTTGPMVAQPKPWDLARAQQLLQPAP
jgi:hypothetical protein